MRRRRARRGGGERGGGARAARKKKNRGSASVGSALAEAEPRALGAATDLWRAGDLSTLDYLIYLNVASGRSHSDLSQWPVMSGS